MLKIMGHIAGGQHREGQNGDGKMKTFRITLIPHSICAVYFECIYLHLYFLNILQAARNNLKEWLNI